MTRRETLVVSLVGRWISHRSGHLEVSHLGLISGQEAHAMAAAVATTGDPGGPDAPWALVVRHDDGRVWATCSTMLISGLFWAVGADGLAIGADPRAVACAVATHERPLRIDENYIAAYASITPPTDGTPYVGACRLPAGQTATWLPGSTEPRTHSWIATQLAEPPSLRGPQAMQEFLEVFDAAVADLVRRVDGPVVSALSSGLDSTFMVSSLLRSASAPILTLTHAPLPEVVAAHPLGHDIDETWAAELMGAEYPGRLISERVVNNAHVRPLEAAAAASRLSGVPTFAGANHVWISAITQRAADVGAVGWFTGAHGNASFSYDHAYAAAYYAKRGEFIKLAGLGSGGDLRGVTRLRSRVVGPLRARLASEPRISERISERIVGRVAGRDADPWTRRVADLSYEGSADRDRWLRWLVRSNSSRVASASPAATRGVLKLDPFCARSVLRVAARIEPSEWQRGGLDRAFARRAGDGRVPDAIRLRKRRTQQSMDSWFVVRNDRDDYLDRVEMVGRAPGLGEVNVTELRRQLEAWPWGQMQGPPRLEQVRAERLLALAEFVLTAPSNAGVT